MNELSKTQVRSMKKLDLVATYMELQQTASRIETELTSRALECKVKNDKITSLKKTMESQSQIIEKCKYTILELQESLEAYKSKGFWAKLFS